MLFNLNKKNIFFNGSVLLLIVLICFFNYKHNHKMISNVTLNNEGFQGSYINVTKNKNNLCSNFQNNCVGTNNIDCRDVSIVACQKYEIKCSNKCKNKKLDDDGKKQNDLNKCLDTCNKVKNDCCNRLNKL
jgi:hypothetical protein